MGKPVTTVSTKGQVILPKAVRDSKRWSAGTRLIVENRADGVLLREDEMYVRPTTVDEVAGMLHYDGPPVSIEDMNDAIAIEVKRRSDRGRY